MTEKIRKVLPFPSPVPAMAHYQRVKSSYSVREIKQLFGLSERTVRRWTEAGIIQGTPAGDSGNFTYDFQALTLFRRVREMRTQGLTIKQIEAELQGQMSLFRAEVRQVQVARLLTPFEEALLLHEQGDEKASEFYVEAINAGLSYSYRGIGARVSWNRTGQYLNSYNANPALLRYTVRREMWDASVSYRLRKGHTLFVDVRNITNSPRSWARPAGITNAYIFFTSVNFGVKGDF